MKWRYPIGTGRETGFFIEARQRPVAMSYPPPLADGRPQKHSTPRTLSPPCAAWRRLKKSFLEN
jgi:hypothetical protein